MNRHKERGTQLVELAAVLPVAVFMVLLVVEGANMFRVHQLMTNAAREGARLSILPENRNTTNPTTCVFSAATTTTTNPVCNGIAFYLQNNTVIGNVFIQCPSVTLNVNQATVISAVNYSNVQARCPYELQYLPRIPAISSTVNIVSGSTFRNLY